jgi:peptidoglycan/LPS O-acetylase OafA/YrhL
VSLIGIHGVLRRRRRRIAACVVVLSLSGAVAAAHAAPMSDHMGDGVAMCLAVAAVAGAALLGFGRRSGGTLRFPVIHSLDLPVRDELALLRALPDKRAGPRFLQVFLN